MSKEDNAENKSIKLSVSKIKTFSDCQKKYHFSYVLKLPKKDRDYLTFGKMIHKVLEDFHIEYINGSDKPFNIIMAKAYKNALSEYRLGMTQDAQKEAYEIVDKYLQKITSEKNTISSILSVEKNFNFNISETVLLNGMIDRIQLDPDGVLHVCDYKTSKNSKYLKNDFLQLLTYAYVIYNEDPSVKKVRGSYIMLRHNFEYITKEFSIDEILEIKDKYENYAKMIEEEKLWSPSPTKLCAWCDWVDQCNEGSAFINKGKNIKHGEMSW